MLRLKPLRPSLREKKRYIVYELETTQIDIDMFSFQEALVNEIKKLLGVFQASAAGIMPIKYEQQTKRGILRVNHTAVDPIRSCFVMINKLKEVPVNIHTRGVSGILKKAKSEYFESK